MFILAGLTVRQSPPLESLRKCPKQKWGGEQGGVEAEGMNAVQKNKGNILEYRAYMMTTGGKLEMKQPKSPHFI